jgi:hypothetical protein
VNVSRSEAFIVAVAPFDQVPIDFRPWPKAGQLTRTRCALQWAGKHPCEFQSLEPFSKAPGITFAALCERQIGKPGVLSTE